MFRTLVIGTHKEMLHYFEFSRPLISILSKILSEKKVDFQLSYVNLFSKNILDVITKDFDVLIFSGTSLKDFHYFSLDIQSIFPKLKAKKIIGICAGAQLIAKALSINLIPLSRALIGKHFIEDSSHKKFEVYFLTSYLFDKQHSFLFYEDKGAAFSLKRWGKDFIGYSFHPEVLNSKLIENEILEIISK